MDQKENLHLWGGRFAKETDKLVLDFHSSISFDQRLYKQDIRGSQAHARMLGDQGIISREEAARLIRGLEDVLTDIQQGKAVFSVEAEDIHMNVETLLIAKVGDVGKKVHTARSRNDQVALDARMYAKEEILQCQKLLLALIRTMLDLARDHAEWVMPGFTHLQIAQPITLGHHLMAYVAMFQRDHGRLEDCLKRADVMPLGSGALAGTTYPLNRHQVAEELGFSAVSENSLDGVSDRDYMVEFLSAASLIMVHLSRLSEEIILWASQEWAFIELDDAYSTGSSIMPQKKNPDVAELIRGKSGRVIGDLMGTLTMLKGLPLAYNKDMQEDKEAFFDAMETVQKCLLVMAPLLGTAAFRRERMRQSAAKGFSNATDLADYLVGRGMAFRDAHHVVGTLVGQCASSGRNLEDLSLGEMAAALPESLKDGFMSAEAAEAYIGASVYDALKLENVVGRRMVYGGTAPAEVRAAAARAEAWLEARETL